MEVTNIFSQLRALKSRFRGRGGRLVRNYLVTFVILISGGLLTSGLVEIYFRYYENRDQIARAQAQVANEAVVKIAEYFLELEQKMKSAVTTRDIAVKGLSPDYKFELTKFLMTTPSISEVIALDIDATPRIHISRFRTILPEQEPDYANSASFKQAKQGVTYFGPAHFPADYEPYTTIAVPIERFPGRVVGVLQAEVNLRHVSEIIRNITVGTAGYAYVVARSGDIIAHPDRSLVLRRKKAGHLEQVQAALEPAPYIREPKTIVTRDLYGQQVLSSYAFLPNLDWAVIIERPLAEAYEPLYASLARTSSLILVGFGVALLASVLMARRIVRPLEALRWGVERIGAGDLSHRLEIKTGDEIEILAEEFNKMVAQINRSYHVLEEKVAQRTKQLAALFEVTATANQSLEITPVLEDVCKKIRETFEVDAARIYLLDRDGKSQVLRANCGFHPEAILPRKVPRGRGSVWKVIETGEPILFEDIQIDPSAQAKASLAAGYRFRGVFPIGTKNRFLGTVVCNARVPRHLTADEILLVKSMADQIGAAVNNLSLFEEVKETTHRLEKTNQELLESLDRQTEIAEVLRVMASSPTDLDALLDRILKTVLRLCQAQGGGIFSFDGEAFRHMASVGARSPDLLSFIEKTSFPLGPETPLRRAGLEKRPFHSPDILSDSRFSLPELFRRNGFRSIVAVPMLKEGNLVGGIAIHRTEARPFAEREIDLLATFADQAVIAIESVHLMQELEQRTGELGRLVENLQALGEVSQAVSSTLDLQTVLTTIVSQACRLSRADAGGVYEFDAHGKALLLRATYRLSEEVVQAVHEIRASLGPTVVARTAASREPVQVMDVLEEPGPFHDMLAGLGLRAVLGVPILREGIVFGVLVVAGKTPGKFPAETVDRLQTFATQSVLAIQNARLFRDIEQQRRQLEIANQRLKELDKMKSNFVSNVSHELRTPLTAIEGLASNMMDGITGQINDEQREYLGDIKASSDRLARLIDDLLDLSRIEAGRAEINPTGIPLADLAQEAANGLRVVAKERLINIQADTIAPNLTVWADRDKVLQVLTNLIGNAIKFTSPQGTITVAAHGNGGEWAQVFVTDTGPGIPAEEHERIFDEFYQITPPGRGKSHGAGLGLAICRKLVEMHGGKIWVESDVSTGSSFHFTLPTKPAFAQSPDPRNGGQ